jgi:primosomal protein N' (replication factor Y)
VIVQTFQPDSRAVAFAARHDVPGFLAEELRHREALGYPPYRHIVRVLASGPDAAAPLRVLAEVRGRLAEPGFVGPAPLLRLRGRHRAQLIAKTEEPRRVASAVARLLAAASPAMRRAGLTATVDVDPQTL